MLNGNYCFSVVASNTLSQDQGDTGIALPISTSANSTPPTILVPSSSSDVVTPSSVSSSPATGKDKVMMPSGVSLAIMPPAGATSSQMTSTAVVPAHVAAGIGVGFPMPHPGDGSTDFSKTEMVTPETSLNMSMAAFLAR